MSRVVILALALLFGAAAVASAQTLTPDSENGRYTFKQMGEEMMRLDGRTGQVSLCSKRSAGWACLLVPDERSAMETEIVRLQAENAAIKKELISRGIALPTGVHAPQRAEPKADELVIKLPSDADLDKVMGFMERIWRRLSDMVQMQKDKKN